MRIFGLNRIAPMSLAAALLLGLALAPAAAQQGTMSPEQACSGDAFRLCNDFIPDRAKVGACLRRNARSLSSDCRGFVLGGRHVAAHGRTHVRAYRHSRRHR
jgi:hypothetical protein